jgi:hypothetical protein
VGFEEEYQTFMNIHLQARSGERLRRLQEGHKHAEMMFLKHVWWRGLPFIISNICVQNMK